jgi:ABC-2 type transport system ATP-binding protein
MNEYILSTDNLTRDFGALRAVDHLSMDVPRGIIFGFLGPNGSGKTTTIRLLLGLIKASSGQARVLGHAVDRESDAIREQCGTLLEHTGLYERLSAWDNLEFYGRVWRLPARQRRERIDELLNEMGLWDRRKEVVGSWSRGMKQKLAIARTLLHNPELVFLDEPTAGLDPLAAATLHESLAGLVKNRKVTVFLTTHNLAEAEKMCAQVAVIRQGKLLAVGAPDQLRALKEPQVEISGTGFSESLLDALRVYPDLNKVERLNDGLRLTFNQPINMAPLVSLLVQAGVQIEEIKKSKASLEDVFLTLMEEENVN